MPPVLLAIVLRIPLNGVREFQAYEDRVLPLLAKHGGTLERRLRNADGTMEMHVVRFTTRSGFDSFRADPERAAAATLFASSGASAELSEMSDV